MRAHIDVFFPERGETVALARSFCARCPVWERCLVQGLGGDELAGSVTVGIYGGTSSRVRRMIRTGAPTVIAALGVLVAWDGTTLDVIGVLDELDGQPSKTNSRAVAARGRIPQAPHAPLSVVSGPSSAATAIGRSSPRGDPLPLVASGA